MNGQSLLSTQRKRTIDFRSSELLLLTLWLAKPNMPDDLATSKKWRLHKLPWLATLMFGNWMAASLAFALLVCMPHADADTLVGKTVGISDGDTITVLVDRREVKVRVAGIDAPEKKQAFGQRSKESLSECAFGKSVSVDWNKKDRYGRIIGKVTSDGVDCGLRQIEIGIAWHYKAYAKEQSSTDLAAYADAESQAMDRKIGLWSDPRPIPPWIFRHPDKSNHND